MSSRLTVAALTGSALALLLAGCATAPAGQSKAASPRVSAAAAQPVKPVGPPAGSRAEAYQFARRMLSAVILPAGARRLSPRRQPAFLRTFAGHVVQAGPWISPFRLYRVPMPMAAVIAFVQGHLPAVEGNQSWGKMLGGSPTGSEADAPTTAEYVDAQARRVPSGIDLGELQYAVVPGHGGTSVLQVNAQVVWYPPRPAAEDFSAATFRAVKLSGQAAHDRTVTRTFTSRQLVARVVSLLDELRVSTTPATTCGLLADGTGSPALELLPASAGRQPVTAEFADCPGYLIYLGGKAEPPLQPQFPRDRLSAFITRLLGLPR